MKDKILSFIDTIAIKYNQNVVSEIDQFCWVLFGSAVLVLLSVWFWQLCQEK